MTISKKLSVVGGVTIDQCGGCCNGSGSTAWPLEAACQTVTAEIGNSMSVNSPVSWVDLLAGSGITAAGFVYLKVQNATNFEVRFTTPSAADQVMRLSDFFLYSSPVLGQQITALAVRGVGDLQRLIAGT